MMVRVASSKNEEDHETRCFTTIPPILNQDDSHDSDNEDTWQNELHDFFEMHSSSNRL